MADKKFKIPQEDIKVIIPNAGSCIASDKITVEGLPVRYMYREEPDFETDTGWRFFSGTESQDYVDNAENMMIYNLNTILNYDITILPYLNLDYGSELEKSKNDKFKLIK